MTVSGKIINRSCCVRETPCGRVTPLHIYLCCTLAVVDLNRVSRPKRPLNDVRTFSYAFYVCVFIVSVFLVPSEHNRDADALEITSCSSAHKKAFFAVAEIAFPINFVQTRATADQLTSYQLIQTYLGKGSIFCIHTEKLWTSCNKCDLKDLVHSGCDIREHLCHPSPHSHQVCCPFFRRCQYHLHTESV